MTANAPSRPDSRTPLRLASTDLTNARLPVRSRRAFVLFVVMTCVLVVGIVLSIAIGQLTITVPEMLAATCRRLTWCPPDPSAIYTDGGLWEVRLPRVALTIVVGAALAAAGAVMQGVFGNPLADPGIIGVSSGAALGAATAIVLGIGQLSSFGVPLAAFATGIATTFLVYSVSRSRGRTEIITLILTGIAVNAVAGAGLAYLTFAATTNQREQIVFWQMGSMGGALWYQVWTVLPLTALGILGIVPILRKLDLLALGDDAARHLGVDIERLRIYAIVVVAVLTAAAVAFAGIIGFVGLVVPHLVRMIVGPGHRVLVPASVLGGACMLTIADTVARTVVAYGELPIGMITALVGGPFFFYLLRRTRSRTGGWV